MSENKELVPVWVCSQPAVVDQNLVDLGARLIRITDTLENLPRDRSSIPEVKKLRAEMRKYFESLEDQRKAVKKAVLEPYEQAEAVYKSLVAEPIKCVDKLCKGFVDEVETAVKKECEDGLREYFTELCQMKGIYWLPFERLGIKVDMAMANQKEPRKAKEQIKAFVEGVDQALATISGMEDSTDILEEYTRTLDLAKAIANVNERKKSREVMEQNRAKWQETRDSRAQNAAAIAEQSPEIGRVVRTQQEKKLRTTFTVTATMPMLRGLKAFLEGNNYEYQEVTENG